MPGKGTSQLVFSGHPHHHSSRTCSTSTTSRSVPCRSRACKKSSEARSYLSLLMPCQGRSARAAARPAPIDLRLVDQLEECLVDQLCRLQGVPRRLAGNVASGQRAQLSIDQLGKLGNCRAVATADDVEHSRDFAGAFSHEHTLSLLGGTVGILGVHGLAQPPRTQPQII